ncbi:hypothetical protein ACWGH5_28095 [Streptomyces sp. NPDC054864]
MLGPAVGESRGQLREPCEVPLVGRASGQHRQQQAPPRGVLIGVEDLQVPRLAQRGQKLEELRGALVDVSCGLQEHGVGD